MEALNSNPVASSARGVHEELSRFHPQGDGDLADVLLDPFSLPRNIFPTSGVGIIEVVARCPRKSGPHIDDWVFKTLRALRKHWGPPAHLPV
jgi:hypothetical protein